MLEEDGKEYVWIVEEPAMTVSRHEIQTQSVNAAGVLIKGVAPKQRIVTAGAHFLAEGEQVRLLGVTQREGTGS